MTDQPRDNREKVQEIVVGSVVLEMYRKKDSRSGKVFYDLRVAREFPINDDEFGRGPFIQQRDLRDLIIAAVNAMEWTSDQHRIIRETGSEKDCDYLTQDR